MNPLIALLTKLRFGIWTVFLTGTLLLTALVGSASAIGAPLQAMRLTIAPDALVAVNGQTKALLHVNDAKFATAPVDPSIKSENARDILLNQENIAGVNAPVVRSEDSEKAVSTFLHLNPAVASAPEPSIPVKLETLKEKLTKRGVEYPADVQPVIKPIQPVAKPIIPDIKPFDKVSGAIKGLFNDADH